MGERLFTKQEMKDWFLLTIAGMRRELGAVDGAYFISLCAKAMKIDAAWLMMRCDQEMAKYDAREAAGNADDEAR